jgi:hypothetical protein
MTATLYLPNQPPQVVQLDAFTWPLPKDNSQYYKHISELLGCTRNLIDVLDCGPTYAAYSIFDFEGAPNHTAMNVLAAISAHPYDIEDDDQVLQGPVLVIIA